jgi:hypothetical protein
VRLVPRVHRLTEQRDLPHARRHQPLRFGDDLITGAIALGAACVRHDAIRAALIAALHDRDVGAYLASQWLRVRLQEARRFEIEDRASDRWAPCPYVTDQTWQLDDVVRADHDIDEIDLFEQRFSALLRHASSHHHHQVALALFELAKCARRAAQLVVRFLADAAGVEHDQIGQLGGIGRGVTRARKCLLDPQGIVDIHLAAEGLDQVTTHQSRAVWANPGRTATRASAPGPHIAAATASTTTRRGR